MSDQNSTAVQLHKISEGTFLFCSAQGNILFGCPPEVLKRILTMHLPMPDTVVVPEQLHHQSCSQASLEFPLYHFLFVQRGLERKHRFHVVALPAQCKALAEMLRVTVVGPSAEEMTKVGTPADVAKDVAQETTYLALKNPAQGGKPYRVEEMIDFRPLQPGERLTAYAQREKHPEVLLERTGGAQYRVLYGEDVYEVDLSVSSEQTPNYAIKHQPFDRSKGKFTLTVLGRSNGFDPKDPANGYLLNIDGKIVLWDCPAYLRQHLKALKLDAKDIDVFILSHVHEDHLDASESLRDPPFELWTTPEVYYSLGLKLAAIYGCTPEEAKRYHHWHPIDVTKPATDIVPGATFEFFHAVHAIPALGVRIQATVGGRNGLLHISGDHLSNAALATMLEGKGISPQRYQKVTNLLTGQETLVLIDAGGGAIHGDYHDYLSQPGRIAYMHTGLIQEDLPDQQQLVKSGQVLDVLG